MLLSSQSLGEDVGSHVVGANVLQLDDASIDLLSDEAMLSVDVLGTCVAAAAVLGEGNAALTVGVQGGGLLHVVAEGSEEATPPDGLLGSVSGSHVLGLH